MHKNGIKDAHLRFIRPYFAPFLVHFHVVHRWAFECPSPYTHMFGA